MSNSANINKVLEVDLDTDRTGFQLRILQVTNVGRPRERQPDTDENDKDNLIILVNALLATILKLEEGECEKGEAMRKAVESLNEGYVDASAKVVIRKNILDPNKVYSGGYYNKDIDGGSK